jgi:hypothetical protein
MGDRLEVEAAILLDGETVLPGGGAADVVLEALLDVRLRDKPIEDLAHAKARETDRERERERGTCTNAERKEERGRRETESSYATA